MRSALTTITIRSDLPVFDSMRNRSTRLLLMLPLTALLGACATQGSFFQESSSRLSIQSTPPGAQIWIMGKQQGTTPAHLPVSQVFPQVYRPDDQALYGQVRLVKDGCDPLTVAVSTSAVAAGIDAKLVCAETAAAMPVTPTASPRTSSATVTAPRPSASARARLVELKELRQDNLISEQEYQRLRQRVLDTL